MSVCETVVGLYTLEAVVRCNKTISSLLWQGAVLTYLLKTPRDHIYFAIFYYCHFYCRIRGETTLILEVSKGENLVKLFHGNPRCFLTFPLLLGLANRNTR